MDHWNNPPSVVVIILCYNHENYIEEAIDSVLNQDYKGSFDIIVSDDCSSDQSVKRIEEFIHKRQLGSVIAVNKNAINMGIVPHIRDIVAKTKSDLIVFLGGDDKLKPNYLSTMLDFWKSNGRPSCVASPVTLINAEGEECGEFGNVPYRDFSFTATVSRGTAWVFSGFYTREVFDKFPPLPDSIRNEDQVLPFRAVLLDGIGFIERPVRYYRRHGSNFTLSVKMSNAPSFESWISLYAHHLENQIKNFECWQKDIRVAKEWLDPEKMMWANQVIENYIVGLNMELNYIAKPSLKTRLKLIQHIIESKRVKKKAIAMILSPKLWYLLNL